MPRPPVRDSSGLHYERGQTKAPAELQAAAAEAIVAPRFKRYEQHPIRRKAECEARGIPYDAFTHRQRKKAQKQTKERRRDNCSNASRKIWPRLMMLVLQKRRYI